MSSNSLLRLGLFGLVIMLLHGCLSDRCERTVQYVRYDPVYLTLDSMRVEVKAHGPEDLVNPGNLYFYNQYLFINERLKGVHIIDNADPAHPVNIAFIEIPGNRDIAIRNQVLYADMFLDLVAVDISNITQPQLLCREENVFSEYYPFDPNLGYIVEYRQTNVVEEIDCSDALWGSPWFVRNDVLFVDVAFDANGSALELTPGAQASGIGIAGSMARFTLVSDHLYTLDQARMHVFSLSQSCPELKNSVDMRWGIETLFPYQSYLFVGSNNGMLIYDNQNPELPVYLAEFAHAQACDPVFVTEDVAYVTLRDGTSCQNFTNQLDVIDVSNISHPTLIRSYPMQHPHGLSVSDETLYLCEGEGGVKIFDVTDKLGIDQHLLSQIGGLHAFDVIRLPGKDVLMVIGDDGLYQYDIANTGKPELLSSVRILK